MKYVIIFTCIFVLTGGNIEPDISHSLEENNKNLMPEMEDAVFAEHDDNFQNERIAAGRKAKKYSVPHHAYLYITKELPPQIKRCGGTIITSTHILTAAHCIDGYYKVKVVLGADDIFNTGGSGRVTYEVILDFPNTYEYHPEYKYGKDFDVAIITLPAPIPFSRRIQKVRMPLLATAGYSFVGYLAKMSGFGTYRRHAISRRLRFGEARIIPNSECNIFFPDAELSFICTSGFKGQGACIDDMGGSLTINFNTGTVIVGVIAFGPSDCSGSGPKVPTGAVRVPDILEWITLVTKEVYP